MKSARAGARARLSGAFRARLQEAWVEIRDNPGRSVLQALGVMLGVASVLGGFSISDSQRKQSERIFARIGGIDKLNVMPTDLATSGTPSALQNANLGLRLEDANDGNELKTAQGVNATSMQRRRTCCQSPLGPDLSRDRAAS